MMDDGSILITGTSGTIGTALADSLLSAGYELTCVDERPNRWSESIGDRTHIADLTNENAVASLPESPDLVVHLAAHARVHKLIENPGLAKKNFDMTFNMLEYARRAGADFVFASSREVYGNGTMMIQEETDANVVDCGSPYTASKFGGEALVQAYAQCYDIDICNVRLSNVYGKFDASDRVIPLFIARANRGHDLIVYDEAKVLDFTYIDDCVTGIHKIITQFNKASGNTFNIASGRGTALVEIAEMIREKTGADVSIKFKPNRTGEVRRYVADISKAERVLDYQPVHDISAGIEQTIEWYEARPELFDAILS